MLGFGDSGCVLGSRSAGAACVGQPPVAAVTREEENEAAIAVSVTGMPLAGVFAALAGPQITLEGLVARAVPAEPPRSRGLPQVWRGREPGRRAGTVDRPA